MGWKANFSIFSINVLLPLLFLCFIQVRISILGGFLYFKESFLSGISAIFMFSLSVQINWCLLSFLIVWILWPPQFLRAISAFSSRIICWGSHCCFCYNSIKFSTFCYILAGVGLPWSKFFEWKILLPVGGPDSCVRNITNWNLSICWKFLSTGVTLSSMVLMVMLLQILHMMPFLVRFKYKCVLFLLIICFNPINVESTENLRLRLILIIDIF